MTSRRAIIGKYSDGVSYGVRCALPGFDSYTDAGPGLSFDSNWTDLLKLHAAGIASFPDVTQGLQSYVYFPDVGYAPFVEVRKVVGNVVYDDFFSDTSYGASLQIARNFLYGGIPGGAAVLYVVFRVPVPAP